MKWTFSRRSCAVLKEIHPDLARVVRRALVLSPVDFVVIEGRRSSIRQQKLFAAGASLTKNSRHLTGHAVDIAPWISHAIPWNDWSSFECVAQAMMQAAQELSIPLVWGGSWESFKDGPHFELSRECYP
ncbi:Uncharacterised protein [Serratia quinivorans]|uniref:M15 family metallopeptidase n=1 Tax=Serratia quinivorans TaxID=137545 RepID=UPI0021774581|nr:M15 family metallopeptidase [Serratia quinivorans]CAI1659415.1 Uncharacterised protein [Serratia quinivorans]